MPSNAQDFKKSKLAPTPVNQWKKGAGARAVDVELPSGHVAKLRQIPMPQLLADGIFPDSLQGYIRKAIGQETEAKPAAPTDHKPKKSKKSQGDLISKDEMAELMSDPAKLSDMFSVFDKVTLLAVVEPKVEPVPQNEEDRSDDLLYVDEVDIEDKTFIFQFCVGGSKDLDRFRTESASAMGGVADIPELPDAS
jgi:hypothetical protein